MLAGLFAEAGQQSGQDGNLGSRFELGRKPIAIWHGGCRQGEEFEQLRIDLVLRISCADTDMADPAVGKNPLCRRIRRREGQNGAADANILE